jgi:hypothetical protein
MGFAGQEEIIVRMESRHDAQHLDFAFPFASRFVIIRMGAWAHGRTINWKDV